MCIIYTSLVLSDSSASLRLLIERLLMCACAAIISAKYIGGSTLVASISLKSSESRSESAESSHFLKESLIWVSSESPLTTLIEDVLSYSGRGKLVFYSPRKLIFDLFIALNLSHSYNEIRMLTWSVQRYMSPVYDEC